jgi:hypothetical protein
VLTPWHAVCLSTDNGRTDLGSASWIEIQEVLAMYIGGGLLTLLLIIILLVILF